MSLLIRLIFLFVFLSGPIKASIVATFEVAAVRNLIAATFEVAAVRNLIAETFEVAAVRNLKLLLIRLIFIFLFFVRTY